MNLFNRLRNFTFTDTAEPIVNGYTICSITGLQISKNLTEPGSYLTFFKPILMHFWRVEMHKFKSCGFQG